MLEQQIEARETSHQNRLGRAALNSLTEIRIPEDIDLQARTNPCASFMATARQIVDYCTELCSSDTHPQGANSQSYGHCVGTSHGLTIVKAAAAYGA